MGTNWNPQNKLDHISLNSSDFADTSNQQLKLMSFATELHTYTSLELKEAEKQDPVKARWAGEASGQVATQNHKFS